MSGFHETALPLALAVGASGGPERLTEVIRLASGEERRNARWSGSRRRWDIGGVVMRADAAHELTAFFEARGGRLCGFRFRDAIDHKSCAPSAAPAATDQAFGEGDGETASFQLVKRYDSAGEARSRRITRPVAGAVLVAVDGVVTTGFSVDTATGVVTFDTPPAEGAVLTAGFHFDTPVRFDMDRLEFVAEGADAFRLVRASVVEIAA